MAKLRGTNNTVSPSATPPGVVYLSPSLAEDQDGNVLIDFGSITLDSMVHAIGASEGKEDKAKVNIGFSVALNPAFKLEGVEETCSHPLILRMASPNAKAGDTIVYNLSVGGRQGNWVKAIPALSIPVPTTE